jgi:hypothetical protein
MAGIQVPIEREQGAVQEQEQIEANAPPPIEPTPTQTDAAMTNVAPEVPVAQPAQQQQTMQQSGYTVKNPYMLMPSTANYSGVMGERPKSSEEQAYDAGLLFQFLGNSNPVFKYISEELMRTRRGPIR